MSVCKAKGIRQFGVVFEPRRMPFQVHFSLQNGLPWLPVPSRKDTGTMSPATFTLPPAGTYGWYCAGTFPYGDDVGGDDVAIAPTNKNARGRLFISS